MARRSWRGQATLYLETMLAEEQIPFLTELQFHPERLWRFDFVLGRTGKDKIAIEIEGGVWVQGRHNRGQGFLNDLEKYNHAAVMGWRVLRFTPEQIVRGAALKFVREILGRDRCATVTTTKTDKATIPAICGGSGRARAGRG